MGQRRNQDQQGPCGNGRCHQWDGDFPDDGPLAGSSDPGTFFQGGIHPFQGADHLHEHKGEIIGDFHENDAAQGIDIERRRRQVEGVHQPGVHIAAPSRKEHIPSHGPEEGWEHVRDHEQGPHQVLAGDIAAPQQPGIEKTDNRPHHRHAEADDDSMGHGTDIILAEYNGLEHLDVQMPFIEEGIVDDHENGDKDDDEQQDEADQRHGLIQAEGFSVQGRQIGRPLAGSTQIHHGPPFWLHNTEAGGNANPLPGLPPPYCSASHPGH